MKMEASITAPVAGTVERLAFTGTQQVEGGDLVLVLSWRPPGARGQSTVNQEDRRPKRARKASPETVTSFLEPWRTSVQTRPFQSPLPSRRVTWMPCRVPTAGYARSIFAAPSSVVH